MDKVSLVTFSPTGTSLGIARTIAEALSPEVAVIDLCDPAVGESVFGPEDLCVLSVPCYGGRIPATAVERLVRVKGDGTPAVVCVTFGNRAFEDALLELADSAHEQGFVVVAGCAVVTEHNIMHVFGTGRPDEADDGQLRSFSADVARKLAEGDRSQPEIPGNRPYKAWGGMHPTILVDADSCVSCGTCARRCPVGAVSAMDYRADQERCIACMRCIKECPAGARSLPEGMVDGMIARLGPACESRKENAFFV